MRFISGGSIATGALNSSTQGAIMNKEFFIRYLIDTLFYVLIVLIILNSLSGMIITSFSQIRDDKKVKDHDIEKKCFICSKEDVEFNKSQVSFTNHKKTEHNLVNYIKFFITFFMYDQREISSEQAFIVDCINKKNISCFPVNKSLSLGVKNIEDDEDGDDEGDDKKNKKKKAGKDKKRVNEKKGNLKKGKNVKKADKGKPKANAKGKKMFAMHF